MRKPINLWKPVEKSSRFPEWPSVRDLSAIARRSSPAPPGPLSEHNARYDTTFSEVDLSEVDLTWESASGRTPFFWMLVRDVSLGRAYTQLMTKYREDPKTLSSDLPHRDPALLQKVAEGLTRCANLLANAEALPEILTAKELEAFLRIDVKTIYRCVQQGRIPYLRMESNLRVSKHQVLAWLRERSFQPRPVNRGGAKRQ